MAQEVEGITEILNQIKSDADKNSQSFEKLLTAISNKLEFMANDTESDDLIKLYLNELKKTLEERQSFVNEEFQKIAKTFDLICTEQEKRPTTENMKDMLGVISNNMLVFSRELQEQKQAFSDYIKDFEKYTTEKQDKNDIINSVSAIKHDVEIINSGFESSISEISANIQSIFKNLIVMDPSAQNDVVKRELENVYLSTNAILTALHAIEQKNDDLLAGIYNFSTKEDIANLLQAVDNSTLKIGNDVLTKTDAILTKLEPVELINGFSTIIEALRVSLTDSNNQLNTSLNEQLNKLDNTLSKLVTDNDFAGFRHDLADFIQKIIDNSSALNENLNLNKETLQNLINKVENLGLNKDMEKISDALENIKNTASGNLKTILGEVNNISDKIDFEPLMNNFQTLNETVSNNAQEMRSLQGEILTRLSDEGDSEKFKCVNNSIDFLRETIVSSQNANEAAIAEKLLAIRDMILTGISSRDEKFSEIKESFDKFIINYTNIANDTNIKIVNSISEITELKTEIENINKGIAEWNYNQDDRDSKLAGVITNELGEITATLETLQDGIQAGLHQEITKNTQLIENQISSLIEYIENVKTELTSKDDSYNLSDEFKEVKDKITAVKQEINLVNTDIIDVLTTKAETLLVEFLPIKAALNNIDDIKSGISNEFEEFKKAFDIDELRTSIDEIYGFINKKFESFANLASINEKVAASAEDIKTSLTEKINSNTEDLKTMFSVAMNNDEVKLSIEDAKSDLSDKLSKIYKESTESNTILNAAQEAINKNSKDIEIISDGNTKIKDLLDIINQKVDTLAMSNEDDGDYSILDEIDEVKNLISSQRDLLEKTSSTDKVSAIEEKLEDLISKIDNIESTDLKDMRETILTAILSVFEQISFIEESEDIKDFVEEKTDEINESIRKVQQQLKQIVNVDDDYAYTLQDVESDIAKLRIVLNDLSNTSSKEEISDISDNIHRIVSTVEELQSSLTQEQMSGLKSDFEKLSEDVLSISSRTNKLLLTSDESYNALNDGLNDFSNVIHTLEERISHFDNKEITERIEEKLDSTYNVVTASANSDKVMRQALMYMGEWIDNASENIESIYENSEKIDDVQTIIEEIENKLPEQKEMIEALERRFDEQQDRMDRLEMKLEKILSAIDDLDDNKLTKKVDKIEKQMTKLSNNIEKLASYVDE